MKLLIPLTLLLVLLQPSVVVAQKKKRVVEYDTVYRPGGGWHLVEKGKVDDISITPGRRTGDDPLGPEEVAVDGDAYTIIKENITFKKGHSVKLGVGTMPDGDFKHITAARDNWLYQATGNLEIGIKGHVGRAWTGHYFIIKDILRYGNPKRGYTYYLKLGGSNIINYECDMVNAVRSGEIVIDGYTPPSQRAQQVIIQNQAPASVADELAKLKKLKDEGVLTEEEFQEQKKKLLNHD